MQLNYLKDNLPTNEVIRIEDFAENNFIRQQNKVMSAHWHAEQVAIFTAVICYRDDNELKHISYAISDDMQQDKGFVFNANRAIFSNIQEKLPFSINYASYFRDGAGSQFKNRYNLGNLVNNKDDFEFKADGSSYETTYGKGPAKALGHQSNVKCGLK